MSLLKHEPYEVRCYFRHQDAPMPRGFQRNAQITAVTVTVAETSMMDTLMLMCESLVRERLLLPPIM